MMRQRSRPSRGLFITLEGIEGCGKSTQARLLGEYLRSQGLVTVETPEPGGTPLAEKIRSAMLDRADEPVAAETEAFLVDVVSPRRWMCSRRAVGSQSYPSTRSMIARRRSSCGANRASDPVLARLPVVPPHTPPRLRLVGSKRKATDAEVAANPRARSAVLRVAERTA